MSLKSFDDFCAKMVNNEPLNYSAVYFDERQKIVRSKILIETLTLFGIAVTLNTLIMEWGLKWCEGYFAPIAVFMALCYLYYILRSVKQGTLFGVENPPNELYGERLRISCGEGRNVNHTFCFIDILCNSSN